MRRPVEGHQPPRGVEPFEGRGSSQFGRMSDPEETARALVHEPTGIDVREALNPPLRSVECARQARCESPRRPIVDNRACGAHVGAARPPPYRAALRVAQRGESHVSDPTPAHRHRPRRTHPPARTTQGAGRSASWQPSGAPRGGAAPGPVGPGDQPRRARRWVGVSRRLAGSVSRARQAALICSLGSPARPAPTSVQTRSSSGWARA